MQLSNSSLSVFVECARCFYFDRVLKQPRPRGIFSSLPGGIDGLLKERYATQRGTLPEILKRPELEGYELFKNTALLSKYQNWRGNPLNYNDGKGNILAGALDELLYNPKKKLYVPADFKTRGSKPDQAYCEKYYQKQIDIYTFMLEKAGLKTAGFGVLIYFWPVACEESEIKFESDTFIMDTSVDRAQKLFNEAIECVSKKGLPEASASCEYCAMVNTRGKA